MNRPELSTEAKRLHLSSIEIHRIVSYLSCLLFVLVASCNPQQTAADHQYLVTLAEFSITPSVFEVPAGNTLEFQIQNAGVIDHNFSVANSEGNILGNVVLSPGDGDKLNFQVNQEDLKIYCSLPGHEEAGMSGTIIVTK